MVQLDSQYIDRLLQERSNRKQTRKCAILARNLDAVLRLRAAGLSYREIAHAFSEQGAAVSASTVYRFLRDHERSAQGTVTPSENLPDWDSNGGSKHFGGAKTASKTVSNPPGDARQDQASPIEDADDEDLARTEAFEATAEGDALELEAETAFRNKIRKLKQEIENRQTKEMPDTSALRRHIEI